MKNNPVRIAVLSALVCCFCSGGFASGNPAAATPHDRAYELLEQWCDGLIRHQLSDSDPALNGGILCPACGRIHGRCVDAVQPLMLMADRTGDEKYLRAARHAMKWGRNVKRYDGAWMNDINVSDWDGTTVFAAIALYEALEHHGRLLDDSTRHAWREDLESAAAFIYNNDFIYSRRREGWRNMNVNYSASATYVLHALGKLFGREEYIAKARAIASDMEAFFTPAGFLYGEGQNLSPTPKGCLPVDLAYNVEESLPNLISYAHMAGDGSLIKLLERSLATHLEFMLPDGGWDNSWGTRSFKWTYWGGRTSDGCAAAYYLLGRTNLVFAEAAMRNIDILARTTHNGLLYGGTHYRENGVPPCIHHTFAHAKALASMLAVPEYEYRPTALPRDAEYGVKYFRDINTWLVGEGGFRATVTDYDSQYKVKGTHPMGGALSVLWHEKRGPLFAASMNKYSLIEAPNMQADMQTVRTCATPRVEVIADGVMYSNLDDTGSSVRTYRKDGAHVFTVQTSLVDLNQAHPDTGRERVEIRYAFKGETVVITARPEASAGKAGEIRMVLPLIASRTDKVAGQAEKRITVSSEASGVRLATNGKFEILPSNDGRIMAMTPGFGFIPVAVRLEPNNETTVEITVE